MPGQVKQKLGLIDKAVNHFSHVTKGSIFKGHIGPL